MLQYMDKLALSQATMLGMLEDLVSNGSLSACELALIKTVTDDLMA